MGLEAATYISALVASNPTASDPVTQADDHLRLIKAALLATFPNLTGPLTGTQSYINGSCPTGMITMWYSTTASIPAGWALCDGGTYPKNDASGNIVTPDLRDKFIMAAGTANAALSTGGIAAATAITSSSGGGHTPAGTLDSQGAHTHTGVTGSHVLDLTEIPSHAHTFGISAAASTAPGGNTVVAGTNQTTSSVGGGLGHTHTLSSDGAHVHTFTGTAVSAHTHTVATVLPPFFTLAYMMRL